MGTCRYGISLRVFKSIALYWQEKSTLLMNENKRINKSLDTNRTVRWRTLDENMRWITTKTNNRPNFQCTKFSVIELVLTDRRNLSGTRPKSTCGKSSSCQFFVLSCEKIKLPKPLNTKLSVFLFCILCFPPSRKVWTSLSLSGTDFLVF